MMDTYLVKGRLVMESRTAKSPEEGEKTERNVSIFILTLSRHICPSLFLEGSEEVSHTSSCLNAKIFWKI